VGPRNHVLDMGRDPPREGATLGMSNPLKSTGVSATVLYAAKVS